MGDGRQTSMADELERRKDMIKINGGGGREICFSSNERGQLRKVAAFLRKVVNAA